MTAALPTLTYDVATALAQGQRDQQEDAVIADFPLDGDIGFAVLADGMGGHAAGDVASKIVVTEVFSELKLQTGALDTFEANMCDILRDAAEAANDCVRLHTEHHPNSKGMGATLVAPVLVSDRLYWVSIGDSPLFLFRDGKLLQLNEDHSLAGQIELLVHKGLMDQDTADNHPDRHCLTSVLIGDDIARIDCPRKPLTLRDGDIVLAASDGIQFLDDIEIEGLIEEKAHMGSAEIARYLIAALEALDDPHQDNTTLCVIKAGTGETRHAPVHVESDPVDVVSTMMATQLAATTEDGAEPDATEVAIAEVDDTSDAPESKNKITIVARKTLQGLSLLYHFRRPSERSA